MREASLFIPESITDALRSDLATGLRMIADALDGGKLDGKFISANVAAGGRYDDRMHLRIQLDLAALVVQSIVEDGSEPKPATVAARWGDRDSIARMKDKPKF